MSDHIEVDGKHYVEVGYLEMATRTAHRRGEMLEDLLAIIHRDGGQHTHSVGLEQSVKDAKAEYYRLRIVEAHEGSKDR